MTRSKIRSGKNIFWIAGVFLATMASMILLSARIAVANTMNGMSSDTFPMAIYYHPSRGMSASTFSLFIELMVTSIVLIVVGSCIYYFVVIRKKRERRNR